MYCQIQTHLVIRQGVQTSRVIWKVALSSPCLRASLHPYPFFQWYPKSKDILLNLGMKPWNSAFNEQGFRLIIVVVQVGAVEVLRKDRMKFSLPPKFMVFWVFSPWMLMYFFACFFESHLVYDQTQGFGAVFFLLYG
jgi:hypothetical protein